MAPSELKDAIKGKGPTRAVVGDLAGKRPHAMSPQAFWHLMRLEPTAGKTGLHRIVIAVRTLSLSDGTTGRAKAHAASKVDEVGVPQRQHMSSPGKRNLPHVQHHHDSHPL